jgi:dTDP-4-amino-4,6-dideoxygalactose transaminase
VQTPREFDRGHVYHLFPLLTTERDRFQAHMAAAGVETLIHYPIPIPRQQSMRNEDPMMCPIADRVGGEVVSLPMYPALSDPAVEVVATAAAAFRP